MFYKREKTTCSYFFILSLIGLLFFSCSPQYVELKKQKKIEKKQKKELEKKQRKNKIRERNSKSQFKAYYNSYYLAKVKFKDALEELFFQEQNLNISNKNNKNRSTSIDNKNIFDIFFNNIDSELYQLSLENNKYKQSFRSDKPHIKDSAKYIKSYDFLTKSRNISFENNNSNIGNNSIKLLDDAIKYSDIVLDDFYNSKYWLDAAYIKARASYTKNILSSANYYFNEILKDKNSPYYYDSLVRLGFISVRLNDMNRLSEIIEELDSNIDNLESNIKSLDKKNPYKFIRNELFLIKSNYYILKAENGLLLNSSINEIEHYYSLAIENSNNQNQIKSIYAILLSLFKSSNDILKILEYTDRVMVMSNLNKENLSENIYLNDWFKLNRTLNNHHEIYKYINSLEKRSINDKDKIYLLLEEAKTYFSESDIGMSKFILDELLSDYEDEILSHKDYFAQIHYYLGEIFLNNNDYDLALNHFDLSIEKKVNNNPAIKKSKALNSYLELYDQYLMEDTSNSDVDFLSDSLTVDDRDVVKEINNFNIAIPKDYSYQSSNIDTVLFNMGSILYFDLEMENEAFSKFQLIYNNHINSPLIPEVIKILEKLDSSTDWRRSFLGDLKSFTTKEEVINNTLIDSQNEAFRKMNISLEESIEIFENNFIQYNDLLSLYMIAFIYDVYLNNPYKSVEFYNKYLEYENVDNINAVRKRITDIEDMLDDEISIMKQKISYRNALEYLMYDTSSQKDTLVSYLSECEKGKNISFVKKCKTLLDILQFPNPEELRDTLSNNVIAKWTNKKNMDWQIFDISRNLYRYVEDYKLASEYSQVLIEYYEDSEYRNEAYLLLSITDTSKDWSSILSHNMNAAFLEIEKFDPKTGLDVVNAYTQRPIPLTISSKNIVYENHKDSLGIIHNISDDIYSLEYKKNVFLDDKNNGEKFFISKLDESNNNEFYYTLDNSSILKWDTNYSNPQELSKESYYLDENISIIKESISMENKNYRYNINSKKSECLYLGEPNFCYEIKAVPNQDNFYKTMWFLEIKDNIFLKIKENISDIEGNMLFKKEISYQEIDSFYIIDNIKIIDINKDMIKTLNVEDIDINKGFFEKDLMIQNNKKSIEYDLSVLNESLKDLTSLKDTLFPVVLEEVSSNDLEDSTSISDNPFEFVQSINQYFYFIEIATIDGKELNNKDLIVAYNNDIVVGARAYTPGGRVDVPVMGYDNSSENTKISTKGYCEIGDIPIIKVHRENGDIITMNVTLINDDGKLDFQPIGHVYVVLNKE